MSLFFEISLVLLLFIFLFLIFIYIFEKIKLEKIKNFPYYNTILELYLERSYEVVYKEKILVYSLEGLTPDEKIVNEAMKSFVNMVIKMLGPGLTDQFVNLFGSTASFMLNCNYYFINKMETDDIKKNVQDQYISKIM